MTTNQQWRCLAAIMLTVMLFVLAETDTDPLEVSALQDLYKSLNNPPQLRGWKLEGGDPCGEVWMGVSCSGSSIVELQLRGLELLGSLGNQLQHLHNLKNLDVSFNNLQGEISFGLPPNATQINMAYNNLTQGLPFSLPLLTSLVSLNLSHNSLSGPLGNVFSGLQIKEMDLSFNNLTGDLPSSFGSLMNLTSLYLQSNRFTGSIIYLSDLPLTDLNIEDNQFSGIIPSHFQSIPHLWIWGNKFHVEPNYKPWKFPLDVIPMIQNATGYPTTESSAIMNFPRPQKVIKKKKKGIGAGSTVLLVGGVALLGTFFALFTVGMSRRRAQNLAASHRSNNSIAYTLPVSTGREFSAAPEDSQQMKRVRPPPVPQLRRVPPPPKTAGRKSFSASCQYPAYAKLFSAAELQLATDGFSEENLLGEGPIGSVYRAKLPDGQFAAVRNIPMSSLSLHEEEKFTEVLQTASKLRHPNIVTLLGFCIDNGQHLLVYEYVGHLSLYNAMHDKVYKPLSWGLRLRIAIGVARALDYLHSSFSVPIAHSDLKATNILLDEELTPRIADCGLASLRPLTSNSVKLRASEIAIQNTGYIAPEHGQPGSSGTKSDTFALGVLLLELLTGRKAFDSSRPQGEQLLVKWASTRLHDRRSLEQMIDQGIVGTFSSRVASHYADIISLCTQAEKEFRPAVSEIVEALTALIEKQNKESSSVADKTEVDPFSKSFCSTRTRFLSSPTFSHVSN
ncbi:Protein STRUBBELIG-RECEPTOR FAMILY 2 [Raphanus sativus]|uniref:Protein STRUBBELIG-RECEPTOR FAMILY 2 n=1 Tax=Raphanus sativus TaxID=3726 RepID=A0A6J0KCY5_RAPSA|nr:protein STRUBBELIG-RECEPTOR FAMILY 2 [Raphanus sativus]KAJ4883325.1 Protein STRUBBELIG-RECEPTOR FAMILY 2 [Raphanus sativus]